jgi:DnaJ-class molecular chaperone
MRKDYCMVLGITKSADLNKIKKAYRKIVKNFHPDVTRNTRFPECGKDFSARFVPEKAHFNQNANFH